MKVTHPMNPENNQTTDKTQIYVMGSVLGLVIGFLAAYFYSRAADEAENEQGLQATDFVKLGLTILGLVRQMTELGSGKK